MELYWICVIALLGVVVSEDASCPTPAELAPCTCDGEGVNCKEARTEDDVQTAFEANFKYGGVRSVWVQGTPLTKLPANLFGDKRILRFYIEVNTITSVDVRAFSGSKKTLKYLSLFGNKIKTFDYGGLSMYENLETVNLAGNQIETLPDDAFNSNSLKHVILTDNKISKIGKNAFSDLPKLIRLELSENELAKLDAMSLATKVSGLSINLFRNSISYVSSSAFSGTKPKLINLSHNKLTSLTKKAFKNLVTTVMDEEGSIDVTGNPFTCEGCDYSWLVANKDILINKLAGFSCVDGSSLSDLTSSNIGCYS